MKILLIEDDAADVRLLQALLRRGGLAPYKLTHTAWLGEALRFLEQRPFDVVIADMQLPDARGVEIITQVVQVAGHTPVIALSGQDSDGQIVAQALCAGARRYLVKWEPHDDSAGLARTLRDVVGRE